jgi:hypothetical protein
MVDLLIGVIIGAVVTLTYNAYILGKFKDGIQFSDFKPGY